jgi:hypothetical protein
VACWRAILVITEVQSLNTRAFVRTDSKWVCLPGRELYPLSIRSVRVSIQ